ncbi:MAG: hypothetical protein NZ988_00185 [Thaumarchaeota archaeon]|nr:hypothetical protein [Candidatus Calditenuaceae archaeon]MDW8186460.1 hypothetical protein [Nitrososphaerota archaeon]
MSYRRGRRFEYEVRDLFRLRGWFVIRAAASKPVDLVCMKRGSVVLVECKYGDKPTRTELEQVRFISQSVGATAVIAVKERYGKISFYDALTGEEFVP